MKRIKKVANDLLKKIDNTVLDLQASHSQTYESELKKLARLLNHADLQPYNETLTSGIDLESYLVECKETVGGFGSGSLKWTEDDDENLGIKLLIIQQFSKVDGFAWNFSHDYFNSGRKIIDSVHAMVRNLIIPFVRDYKAYIQSQGASKVELKMPVSNNKIFIVHGHDNAALQGLARYLEKSEFDAIILHEQANSGRTIIEKIEANSDVGFAVVLLTPDDLGKAKDDQELSPRARQNVIMELGYFIGKLGRDRVCALKSANLEIPSDYVGVVWTEMDQAGAWKINLARELKAAGYAVDMTSMF